MRTRLALAPVVLLTLTMCRPGSVSHPTGVPALSGVDGAGAVTTPPPLPVAAPRPALSLRPLDAAGASSAGAVALARLDGRTLAFVADTDDRAVVTFDVDTRARLATTPLGARPSAVLVTPGGRVIALGADDARVHLLALVAPDEPLVTERTFPVPAEPVSAAVTPDGGTLLVVSRWGHALSIARLASVEAPVVVALPRDPTAVVASSDGLRAVVLHAAGSRATHVVLATREVRTVSLDRSFQQEVRSWGMMMAMPQDPLPVPASEPRRAPRTETVTLRTDQAFTLARLDSGDLVAPAVAAEAAAVPDVVTLDAAWSGEKAPGGQRIFGSHCLLPRAASVDAAHRRLLVACLGSDELAIVRLRRDGPKLGVATKVAKGPVGLAVDAEGQRAVVWSAFERVVSVVALERLPRVTSTTTLARTTAEPDEAVTRGRALFHAVLDERISADGRACASCHPDGRDDGLSWSAPGGRRQTPMLVERLEGTAPYGWDGSAKDLVHHVAHTTERLGGRGLRARDVADLAAYLATLHPPATPVEDVPEAVARGAKLFASEETECSGCHTGGGTDGESHVVEGGHPRAPRRGLDTPSLHLVGHSAPYFHDGRYPTLGDLLAGVDGTMGHTAQLSTDDRAALEAYLETL